MTTLSEMYAQAMRRADSETRASDLPEPVKRYLEGLFGRMSASRDPIRGNVPGYQRTVEEATGMPRTGETPRGYAARLQTPEGIAETLGFGLNLLGAIKAYHGSPHKFDKFDMSKIGTGEGAQAYGHGLYFAESPEVARSYADDLINDTSLPRPMNDAEDYILSKIKYYRDEVGATPDKTDIAEWMKTDYDPFDGVYRPSRGAPLEHDAVEMALESYYSRLPEGNVYETYLQWPDAGREAFDPLGPQHFPIYNSGVDEALQAELIKKGIPGIRYLDSGSRGGSGSSTYNYVVFDDQIPKIISRNGQPIQTLYELALEGR
jgi:hypothetical protein